MSYKEDIQQKINEVKELLKDTKVNLQELTELKAKYLGKKGFMAELMNYMKTIPNELKPVFGKEVNEAKEIINNYFEEKKKELELEVLNKKLQSEVVDINLPGKELNVTAEHLLNQTIEELEDLFIGMGFNVEKGPEIEDDYFNFELLNLPKGHPARDMQDTFYVTDDVLLRTHTSPVQAHTMLKYNGEKPVRIICPGKVYRRDNDDATHSHQFMQIEGLVVGEDVSLAELKGVLLEVARKLFGEGREIRLRPSYFPFTEPSVEVDVSCAKCGGKGCNICKGTGWIEILGAGMVNNNVLKMCGYDSDKYQGYAFGLGVERMTMLKYRIDDVREFYINDMRFNKQFK